MLEYVNNKTGEFFTDEKDVGNSLEILLDKIKKNEYSPRDNFIENFGVIKSGKNFKNFLYSNFRKRLNIDESLVDYVTPDNMKKDFKPCEPIKDIYK